MQRRAVKSRWKKITPEERSQIMKKVRMGKKKAGARGTKHGRPHP
jgi:predicted Fe-S protein YdhL (DUF1289 family)